MPKSREIHLTSRPTGMPTEANFALVERDVPRRRRRRGAGAEPLHVGRPGHASALDAGQELNEAMMGGALGRVVQSKSSAFHMGDLGLQPDGLPRVLLKRRQGPAKLSPDPDLPLTVHMHVLGGTGFTAYGGLLHIGALKDGEQVFVSTAAGAWAQSPPRSPSSRAATSWAPPGSDDKAAWLRDEVGLDAVINYKTQPIRKALEEATPKGIDVYFDNVGGDHLEAALRRMNTLGRIPVCGFISGYNSGHSAVSNLSNIIYSRVMLRGFVAPTSCTCMATSSATWPAG
jgi:NADPH-dependent curcumin reductase CurA